MDGCHLQHVPCGSYVTTNGAFAPAATLRSVIAAFDCTTGNRCRGPGQSTIAPAVAFTRRATATIVAPPTSIHNPITSHMPAPSVGNVLPWGKEGARSSTVGRFDIADARSSLNRAGGQVVS